MKSGKSGSSGGDPVLNLMRGHKASSSNGGDPVLSIMAGKAATEKDGLASQVDPNGNPIAHHIWETAKGAGRGLIDFLSRPNYAAAGAAEELFAPQGGGIGAVPGRVASELFSGIGSIKGQKEGFGQVMEQAGVGELGKLSDVMGFMYNDTGEGIALQRGGVLDPTGRGFAGLVGDIFLDPTTYLTAGGSAGRKFLTAKGLKYLSKEGKAVAAAEWKAIEPQFKAALKIGETSERVAKVRELDQAFRTTVLNSLESNPTLLLEKTGIKFMGGEIVSPESLKGLTDFGKSIVTSVPGGARAARGAEALGRGIQRVFDPYADLAGLPTEARNAMKGLLRENRSAAAAHKTILLSEWDQAAAAYNKLAKSYGKGDAGLQALGKRFADWRQGTGGFASQSKQSIPMSYDDWARSLPEGKIGGDYLMDAHPESATGRPLANGSPGVSMEAGRPGKVDFVFRSESGEPVGALHLEMDVETVNGKRQFSKTTPYIADVAVLPEFQRKGIAKSLYAAAENSGLDLSKALGAHEMTQSGSKLVYSQLAKSGKLPTKTALVSSGSKLTPAEEDVFNKITKIYDEMEPVLLREGIIDAEQAAKHSGKYLHQVWKNADEALAETAKKAGRPIDRIVVNEQIQRARVFDTVQEGIDVSKKLKAETEAFRKAGGRGQMYGELVPEYDVIKNLADYIQQSTDAIWRKRTYTEASERFGLPLDAFDPGRTYELNTARRVNPGVRAAIDATAKGVEDAGFRDLAGVNALLPRLPNSEQKELVRELASRAKSPSQIVNLRTAVGDALMPDLKIVKPGDIDPYYARLGQDGTLHTVQGGLWGEKPIQLPAQIIKMVEEAPSDFIKDAARKKGLQGLVRWYDKYNNLFKAMTYPFYPSGAVRDTYNNVMQAYLGVGVGAFARPFQATRVLKGGDDVLRLGEREFTAKELNTMAKDLGVIDPSGAAYVQFTGDEGVKRTGFLGRARAKRGSVDNLTRSQLFINNIASGMTPQDAAQVVKDFLFDYGELSNFDKDFMRRAMPFYVFPRKAIETYGKAVVKTPGRVVNLAKPFRGREDENNMMTSWEGEGFKLRLDRDGKTLTMLNGVDLPVRTMDMLWAGSPTKTMNRWLSMASPAIKVPYEFLSGQDPFRGQPLGRQQSYFLGPLLKEMPKVAQDFAGFHEDKDAAGRPKYTVRMDRVQVLAEAALISRILSMGERNVKEQAKDPDWTARMLDFLTGLRLKDINFDEQQKLKIETTIRTLQEEKVKQGELRQGNYYYKQKPR